GVVTVVRGSTFGVCLDRWREGLEAGAPEPDADAYERSGLLVDQIEYSDLIYVSNTELRTPEEISLLTEAFRLLQPRARLLFSPLEVASGEGIPFGRWFDERATSQGATRVQALLESTDEFSPPLEKFFGRPYVVYR